MTDDFMTNWLSLWLAAMVGLAPLTTFMLIVRVIVGPEPDQEGCATAGFISLILLIAAPFLGYWCFQTFAVVWRP